MPVLCLSGTVQKVVGNTAIELRMETWAQTTHAGINGLWIVFKTMRLKEIARGGGYREEGF